ncbi:Histone H2B [Handroanthus impetiginosus]|uniref:Histone H2B n=1 Tax=Handroanthus impetiginosus TaxID=429701 RepID=A0A2G9GKI7_9LAMI|nr:Histone H2B [Handroanthus impetiginosus]
MAPKRRPRAAVKTVVTSKKVVEETVEVVVTPEGQNEKVELVSSSTQENKNVEIFTTPEKEPVSKTIPVQEAQEEDETQPASEQETAPTPPQKEAPPPKPAEPETPQVEGKKGTRKTKARTGPEKRRRKRYSGIGEGREGYQRYVFRVMKQVHPDLGISSKAMTVMNNLMWDMFERLAEEAARLQKYTGRRTMSSREVQAAVKLVLPGELGKHAIAEGTKAVSNYVSNVSGGQRTKT